MTLRIVTLEGPDGVGKSRQCDAVVEALRAMGASASAFHHPAPPEEAQEPVARAFWYWSKRADLVLSREDTDTGIVVCDRWYFSTLVEGRATGLCDPSFGARRRACKLVEIFDAEKRTDRRNPYCVFLEAPGELLDARLFARHAPPSEMDRARRAAYRVTSYQYAQAVFDTSQPFEANTLAITHAIVRGLGLETSR